MDFSVKNLVVLLIYLNLCFKDANAVIWPCQSQSDCDSVESATCSPYGSCVCPAGYVFLPNLTKCIPAVLYGDSCSESVQCSYMPSGASCKIGTCQCDEGLTYIRGRCKKLSSLNGTCNETIDCEFGADRESVTCRNGKCDCADGYYRRSKNICRRKSMDIEDPCIVDSDCDSIVPNGAKCKVYKCQEKGKSRFFKEIAVQTSFINLNAEFENQSNISEKAKHDFEENIELSTLSPVSENETKKFGDSCSKIGQPCEHLRHSICVENVCLCKLGYYHRKSICMAELGEKADTSEFCENGVFDNTTSMCVCPRNYFYEPDLRTCKKPILLEGSCTSNSQCTPFGAAFCNTSSVPKKCECKVYARLNEEHQLCELKTGLGSTCDDNKDCRVRNSICSTSEKLCVCSPRFVEKGDVCLAGVNTECTTNEDCAAENSTCISPIINTKNESSTVCQCKKGFVHFDDECVKAASEYGDECTNNEQCKPLLGELGKCVENKCICDANHHLSYGKCEERRSLGEKCSRGSQCYTPEGSKGTECRNEVCRCQYGYLHDPNKLFCVKPKTNSSSGGPSMLKIITFILVGSAFFITSAAIKQAYY